MRALRNAARHDPSGNCCFTSSPPALLLPLRHDARDVPPRPGDWQGTCNAARLIGSRQVRSAAHSIVTCVESRVELWLVGKQRPEALRCSPDECGPWEESGSCVLVFTAILLLQKSGVCCICTYAESASALLDTCHGLGITMVTSSELIVARHTLSAWSLTRKCTIGASPSLNVSPSAFGVQ